jgi:hypothetical protein
MLTITNAAYSRLHELLSTQPAEIAARLLRKDDRTRVRRDKKRPGDKVVKHEGRVVLLMDKSMSQCLQDKVLDVRKPQVWTATGSQRSNCQLASLVEGSLGFSNAKRDLPLSAPPHAFGVMH